MTNKRNLAIVRAWFRLLARGEYAKMHDLQSKDVVWDVIAGPSETLVPWLGKFRGRAGIDRCLARFSGAVESEAFELHDFLTGPGGQVAVIGRTRLRERQTGARMHIDFVEYFRLRRGKIAYVRVYGDSAGAACAFAALPRRATTRTTKRAAR